VITYLADIPLPGAPHTTLNVGLVSGGTSINTIAAQAVLELDLRSEQSPVLAELVERVMETVKRVEHADVRVEVQEIGSRPSGYIPIDHRLVLLAQRCLLEQGIQPELACSSTDANLPLSRGYPALCLG